MHLLGESAKRGSGFQLEEANSPVKGKLIGTPEFFTTYFKQRGHIGNWFDCDFSNASIFGISGNFTLLIKDGTCTSYVHKCK